MPDQAIEVLLDEKRNFPPPKEFKKSANARSAGIFKTARKNPQAFWAKAAKVTLLSTLSCFRNYENIVFSIRWPALDR